MLRTASRQLDAGERSWLDQSRAHGKDAVAGLMSPEVVFIREDQTVDDALVHLRQRGELPPQTDRLFVVDARNVLKGSVPLQALLLTDPRQPATAITGTDDVTFRPDDDAEEAAQAFERYNLVSAPVVDDRNKLIGRLTVEAVMDFNRQLAERRALERAGLRREEDLFASTWASARNRWPWLCVNLVTAFIASRVIGAFEGTIQQLVALAALMPIVASIGGNTGNQTVAVVIRGLALNQVEGGNTSYLIYKELMVSLLNGLMWGGIMGAVRLGHLRPAGARRRDDGGDGAEPAPRGDGRHRRAVAARTEPAAIPRRAPACCSRSPPTAAVSSSSSAWRGCSWCERRTRNGAAGVASDRPRVSFSEAARTCSEDSAACSGRRRRRRPPASCRSGRSSPRCPGTSSRRPCRTSACW